MPDSLQRLLTLPCTLQVLRHDPKYPGGDPVYQHEAGRKRPRDHDVGTNTDTPTASSFSTLLTKKMVLPGISPRQYRLFPLCPFAEAAARYGGYHPANEGEGYAAGRGPGGAQG